jgi:hypothetical protein
MCVDFVRVGLIVDNTEDLLSIIKHMTAAMQGMLDAILHTHKAVQDIESRLKALENEQ